MKCCLIKETLEPCGPDGLFSEAGVQYVAVLSTDEWKKDRSGFRMRIEIDPIARPIHSSKAEVSFGSLTGSFRIPDRNDLTEKDYRFAFALDEKGVVFIDDTGVATRMIGEIARSKKYTEPGLERFMYDFLEQIISRDLPIMERYETELDDIEDEILRDGEDENMVIVNDILSNVRELRIHYEQLIDMTQELLENENGFFNEERLRFLQLFMNRLSRLHTNAASLREHTMQVRDLYRAHLEEKQNGIMTILTVVTTIFMPLTLIVGWYGMNFRYMPELDNPWSYPVLIVVSVLIIVGSLIFFKKKKWL